jgi:adenylosuccinate synthase
LCLFFVETLALTRFLRVLAIILKLIDMKIDVLLGLQWGDEGKGKGVDLLTPQYDVVTRFQGGPNAGHSLEFNGKKHVLHLVPSGIFHDSINLVGNGVVLDPVKFDIELQGLQAMGIDPFKKILLSRKAHLILPSHRVLDAAIEHAKGKEKIGSTLRGIGPTYRDKVGRDGLRIGDIETIDFKEKYNKLKAKHQLLLKQYNFEYDLAKDEEEWFEAIEVLKKFEFVNSEYRIEQYFREGKKILAEGAQGSLLDIDFGSYPFVTSSSTTIGGACTGMGIAPQKIGKIIGIAKAYCTRVGSGPFPTELHNAEGQQLRDKGAEYGSTTGRPRRCGWLDLVALKYVVMLNGVTEIILTKSDVLDEFETIKVCTAYEINGEETLEIPFDINAPINPVYTELKGWNTQIKDIRKPEELPAAFIEYVKFIEHHIEVPVSIVSVGPDREATIHM